MSEEDDWFERALRDIDADSDAATDEGDGETDDEVGDADDETDDTDKGATGAPGAGADGSDDREDERESDPFGGIRDGERDPARDVDVDDDFDGGEFEGGEGDGIDGDDFDGDDFDDDVFGASESGTSESEADSPDDGGSFDGDADGPDPFGGESSPADGEGEDEPVDDPFGGGSFGGGSFGEEDPFGGGGGSGGGGSFGDSDPFGGGGSSGGGGASGGSSPGGEPTGSSPASGGSADPFGGYRGNAAGGSGGPDDVGFGEFEGGEGGDGSAEFDVDPDEFESSIERTDIGIEGLDEMILGGVPRRSLLSVIGGAGTGKTTFALQFLNEALDSERKGIYITLEQTRESILSTAEEKGWSFREHADEDRLAVVAIDPIEMANSLASIRNDLVRLIAEFDADRLVLDSVSLLEMMYDHPAKRRSEVFGFTRSLKNAGVTTLLTSEASEESPYASRHGIVEYLTDAVFVLQYIRGTDFRETRLAVEIQKIRDANHSRQSKPYDITDSGISVYGQANIF